MADEDEDGKAGGLTMPHFEDVTAPTVYADACFGGGFMGGNNITLTFAAKMLNHTTNPPAGHTRTVLRLVIPAGGAERMAEFIKQFLTPPEGDEQPPPTNATIN